MLLSSSLCTQETLLQQSSLARGVRQRWPCFLLTSFTALQLGFLYWHRAAVLGLSCPEEREDLAASLAQVPRLSTAGAWGPSLGRDLLTPLQTSPGCSQKGVFSYLRTSISLPPKPG